VSKKAFALLCIVTWVAGITALNYVANREPPRKGDRFRVGFLPVT